MDRRAWQATIRGVVRIWHDALEKAMATHSSVLAWRIPGTGEPDPMDCSLPGSSVHRIFQARVLEWGAIAFSVKELRGL